MGPSEGARRARDRGLSDARVRRAGHGCAHDAGCHNACVRDERLAVLWLCGPPGAGKSATGWALYDGLVRSGARAGFVDIDQLGMCFPAPPHDPELFLLKERNVSVVAAKFCRIG